MKTDCNPVPITIFTPLKTRVPQTLKWDYDSVLQTLFMPKEAVRYVDYFQCSYIGIYNEHL